VVLKISKHSFGRASLFKTKYHSMSLVRSPECLICLFFCHKHWAWGVPGESPAEGFLGVFPAEFLQGIPKAGFPGVSPAEFPWGVPKAGFPRDFQDHAWFPRGFPAEFPWGIPKSGIHLGLSGPVCCGASLVCSCCNASSCCCTNFLSLSFSALLPSCSCSAHLS